MNYELRMKMEESTANSKFEIRNSIIDFKQGFTLLEVMVASLLLAMLVTILTMIFNQSSIAWTTGTASVAGLGRTREKMAIVGLKADNVLDPQNGRQVISIWNPNGAGLNTEHRTVDRRGGDNVPGSLPQMRDPYQGEYLSVGGGSTDGKDTYIVGVTSDGPDRTPNTWDDITTLPEEMD